MTDETLIAVSELAEHDGGRLIAGTEIAATPKDLIARWNTGPGGCLGYLYVPWPDVLKHAPIDEIIKALYDRPEVYAAMDNGVQFAFHGRRARKGGPPP